MSDKPRRPGDGRFPKPPIDLRPPPDYVGVWSWGDNHYGQLGVGSALTSIGAHKSTTPVRVSDLSLVKMSPEFVMVVPLAAGTRHSIAVNPDGTVCTWGDNNSGQLGTDTLVASTVPYTLSLQNINAVAAGHYHSLALDADRHLWAWGSNAYGAVGDGAVQQYTKPYPATVGVDAWEPVWVKTPGNVLRIAAGGDHSLAIDEHGIVWAWGRNSRGQVSKGCGLIQRLPVTVKTSTGAALGHVSTVAAGGSHSLAIVRDPNGGIGGTVWAWGANDWGQLGDNTLVDRDVPVQVKAPTGTDFLTDVVAIAAGGTHSLAVKADGTVWAWGSNHDGELGDWTIDSRKRPVQVRDLLLGVSDGAKRGPIIAAGSSSSYALATDGRILSWGFNMNGELGIGSNRQHSLGATPAGPGQPKSATYEIAWITAGTSHAIAGWARKASAGPSAA